MPGIYGYKKCDADDTLLSLMTTSMRSVFTDRIPQLETEFSNQYVQMSAIHTFPRKQYFYSGFDLRIEGESYNWQDVAKLFTLQVNSFEELLIEGYTANILPSILNKINGYFCASIYDIKRNKLFLFSDRWGMRFLYYYFNGDDFAWASEVKALTALPFIDKQIDSNSLSCFIDIGYLLGEHTWHKKIKLIKPASIMEYDVVSSKISQKYYWKWSEIRQQVLSFDSAVEKLSELMLNAVRKQFNPNEKIGVSLSGGLDSRMLLAAVNKLYPDYRGYCYTFGIPNCDDVKIAKLVAEKANWCHQVFEFTSDNWFKSRLKRIDYSDGMQNMLHMHGGDFLEQVGKRMEINLNGYAGDAITGSSFIDRQNMDKRISIDFAKKYYKKYVDLADIHDSFYDFPNIFPNLFANRVRRFTTMGTINLLMSIEQRKPFLDNELMEFVFSLPDSYRKGNKLYSAALLKTFPDFFSIIPWQKTGKPISQKNSLVGDSVAFVKLVLRKLNLIKSDSFVDYKNWIKEKDLSEKISKILSPKDSAYSSYTTDDYEKQYLMPHLQGQKDYSEQILRAVTAEIYLSGFR